MAFLKLVASIAVGIVLVWIILVAIMFVIFAGFAIARWICGKIPVKIVRR